MSWKMMLVKTSVILTEDYCLRVSQQQIIRHTYPSSSKVSKVKTYKIDRTTASFEEVEELREQPHLEVMTRL